MKEKTFEEFGLKKTKSRIAVLEKLENSEYPLTAEELHSSLSDQDIDLSTIYRTLKSFLEVGLVKREINEKKENVFSLDNDEDSHVLVCVRCHKKIKLAGCPYHEVNEKIEKDTGFLVQDQNVEIYGLCPDCQKKR